MEPASTAATTGNFSHISSRQLECEELMLESLSARLSVEERRQTGENVFEEVRCPVDWDTILCWPESPAGALAVTSCFEELGGVLYDTNRNIMAMCLFMLRTKHLVMVYTCLMSAGVLLVSYWCNKSTMIAVVSVMTANETSDKFVSSSLLENVLSLNLDKLFDLEGCVCVVVQNFVLQNVLAFIFTYVHVGPRYSLLQRLLHLSFMVPSFLAILPLPVSVLHHAPVFAALMPLSILNFVFLFSTISVVQTLRGGFRDARNFVKNFGLLAFLQTQWLRLNVPTVLRTFWILRLADQASTLIFGAGDAGLNTLLSLSAVLNGTKSLLVSGCETQTAVLGMTSIVSYICHYIGRIFQWVLLAGDDDGKSIGTASAILFYMLALQTGLTSLDPEKRFIRLCRNFCLILTALLQLIHNIVNPLLQSLSASRNLSLHRHIRAVSVCAFLIIFPISLLTYLWSQQAMSTWVFAVFTISVEVIEKVIISLMIYSLFLIDACRTKNWEKLDDYVNYIRAFGHTAEFCFGLLLFCNGAWIFIFESGGVVRALMVCIHAYFNIWRGTRTSWNAFKKWRTATNKINSLAEADAEQLQRLDDVCAICYHEMASAKITRCNHFFHGACLRKWLYIQDRCPLCNEIMYKVEDGPLKGALATREVSPNEYLGEAHNRDLR